MLLFHKILTQAFTLDSGLCLPLVNKNSQETQRFLTWVTQDTEHMYLSLRLRGIIHGS